jgi:hypothetical protein
MRYSLVLLVACLTMQDRPENDWTQQAFEKAVAATSAEYINARDSLLRPSVNVEYIEGKLTNGPPRERLMARVILGWRANKDEYTHLLAQSLADQTGQTRYAWSYEPASIKPNFEPLMYELLLKDVRGASGRDAAVRVINYLARRNVAPDVEALIQLLHESGTPEPTRAALARTIATLPEPLVNPTALLELLQTEGTRRHQSKDVAGNVMNGLIRLAGRLPEQGKDFIVKRLIDMPELPSLVGRVPLVYTIGGVGGERAASVVASFLDQTTRNPSQTRWALSTLGSMGNETAVTALLAYTRKADVAQQFRICAIESLSKSKYNSRVGTALEEIVRNERNSERERVEAVKAFSQLHQKNLQNRPAEIDIRDRLKQLNEAIFAIPHLKNEITRSMNSLGQPRS